MINARDVLGLATRDAIVDVGEGVSAGGLVDQGSALLMVPPVGGSVMMGARFAHGRRRCLGEHVGEATTQLSCQSLLPLAGASAAGGRSSAAAADLSLPSSERLFIMG